LCPNALVVYSQTGPGDKGALQPSRKDLVPVHWPDMSKLEPAVSDQLISLQTSLSEAVQNPATSDATMSEAYGTMGEIYHAYALNSPARECYRNAAQLSPRDFRWAYLLGRLDQQDDRPDEAIRHYQLAITLRPNYSAAQVNLGNAYLQLNRLAEAEQSFKSALEIEKDDPAAEYGLGQLALTRRNYSEAISHFEKALARAPEANRIHYSLAMAYRGLGDAEKAKAQLTQQGPVGVKAADPLFEGLAELIAGERLHLIRGRLALGARRYADAAVEFRQAIAAKPDSLTAHLNLGAALTQTGDLKGAAAEFDEALRLDPTNTIAHYNLAVLLATDNKHQQAIVHLESVFSVDPNDLSARFLLAQELMKSNRLDDSLTEFTRIVAADPDNEDALLEQAKLLQRKGQYKQALETLEKGNARNPQKLQTMTMLAYLLAASPQNDLRDGARALKLAESADKEAGSLQSGAVVAMALAETGRCLDAAERQRKLISRAEQEHQTDLLAKFKNGLKQYEGGPPCRP
jgi:tetratricopeptide (TPR) repeat protein